MNNSALDYDKLEDDEYFEVEEELLRLQQPPSWLHNKKIIFVFTLKGETKHQKLIELLTKASKLGVKRLELDLDQYEIFWQSEDGQLGLSDKKDVEANMPNL